MNKSRDNRVDLSLISTLLDALYMGRADELTPYRSRLENIRDRLVADDSTAREALLEIVHDTVVAHKLSDCVTDDALSFVRNEIARFSEIRASRPFTEDEKRCGKELVSILESLRRLYRIDREQSSK